MVGGSIKSSSKEFAAERDCLWIQNHPREFWQADGSGLDNDWDEAIHLALMSHGSETTKGDIQYYLSQTLGEGRFGKSHWDLSLINSIYWWMKPILPGGLVRKVRSVVNRTKRQIHAPYWPVDDRYVKFLWDVFAYWLDINSMQFARIKSFWPEKKEMAFVLTHDVETPAGQERIPKIIEAERNLGFRSSFNIVGNQIPSDGQLIRDIRDAGFEVGLHGWQHDARPFRSQDAYLPYVTLMNETMQRFNIKGHRSPLNLRQPEWMQSLQIEYDLSFFDTDPFEPIPGGGMSIWPYFIGSFVELPTTLVQDNTLFNLLCEKTTIIWEQKVAYIRQHHGMALLNTHPEYLKEPKVWDQYLSLLEEMAAIPNTWNPLPVEAARWWRDRQTNPETLKEDSLIVERTRNGLDIHPD